MSTPRVVPHVLITETGRRLDAELGWFTVPVRHADPGGPTWDLAYARLPATAARPGPPTVLLAGGPGESGIEMLGWDTDGRAEWIDGLRRIGDVIGLDQRGTGLSFPIPESLERWDLPLDAPGDAAAFHRVALERIAGLREHWLARGVDVGGYTAQESADDVSVLAQALRVDRIRLVGASYGSHLGLAVIRRHADIVDRALLGLVEGPDHTHKLPSSVQRCLGHISAMAAAAPELCADVPDLLGLIVDLLDRLGHQPLRAEAGGRSIVVGAYDLQRSISSCLGEQAAIKQLPRRLLSLADGDGEWLGSAALERRTDPIGSAMYWHTDAASGASRERRARIRGEASANVLGDVINHPFPDVEVALGSPDLGEAFRGPVRSEVPVQFQSGGLDGRTPPSNVDELIAGFPNSGHLIVDGVAHDEGFASPQVRSMMLAFLEGADPVTARTAIAFQFEPIEDPGRASRPS